MNVILLDLCYFFCSILIYLILFFFLQIIIIRRAHGKQVASKINLTIAVSGVLMLIITFFIFRKTYSSISTYVVGTIGSFIASVFILGFYGFSGPVCADRSPSAHMALVLREYLEKGLTRDELKAHYRYEKVFDRRVADFLEARIVQESEKKLILTPKGNRLSRYYSLLLRLLNIPKNY